MTGSGGGLVGWVGEKKGFCCRRSLGPLYVVLLRQDTLAGRPRPSPSRTGSSSPACRLRPAGSETAGVAWFFSRGAACLARLLLQTPLNRPSAARRRPGAAVLPRRLPTFFSISHGSFLLQTGARSVRLPIWSSFPVHLVFLLAPWGVAVCGEGQIEAMPRLSRDEQKQMNKVRFIICTYDGSGQFTRTAATASFMALTAACRFPLAILCKAWYSTLI
jgi:hypothetical protein